MVYFMENRKTLLNMGWFGGKTHNFRKHPDGQLTPIGKFDASNLPSGPDAGDAALLVPDLGWW